MRTTILLVATLLLPTVAPAADQSADLSGTTDASIRQVLQVVGRHQLRELRDGQYPHAASAAEALKAQPPAGIAWNYPWGVTLYGLLRSTDVTGDQDARNFVYQHNAIVGRYYTWQRQLQQQFPSAVAVQRFVDDNRGNKISGLMRLGSLDNTGAMGAEMMESLLRQPDRMTNEQRAVLERVADWISNQQDRLPDGTLWRPERTDVASKWPAGTIWADDLYMSCPLLVRWSEYTHNGKFLNDAAHQVINMAARLQDSDGLWFHAYDEPAHEHSPYKWGRANGWAMVATVEILSAMPENHPDRARLLDIFRRHVDGVKRVQPASGVWHQVLDHSELWEETSCTNMFAYAIARGVNRGWLPASDMDVARKAFAGVCAHYVTPEGVVKGTCEGTGIGLDLQFYVNRRHPDDDYHGRGVVLLAGTEILNPKR